ncbi:cupin domain-containing protein [Ruegeria atlantica]|uniref:cupin domain-containing protein n=1 Tax=Ruegeria atlantica TaxID=81569 RepID=UPI00147ECD65|nr:cupin domain-containing protein [Ruegeria atlantica]
MQKPIRLLADGNPETGFGPSSLVAENDFTTDDKTETISSFFESRDEKISVGVWECAPCREVIEAYPVDEMMTVLSGSLTLTDADGSAQTFTGGDTFFIAKGTPCTWEITQTLRKFYMIAA